MTSAAEEKGELIMDEYIERGALIAEFKRLGLGENSFIERVFTDGVYAIIEQFPAADAAPVVHAYWIGYETMSWRNGRPKRRKYNRCSNCRTATAVRSKACPNCGARMHVSMSTQNRITTDS